MEINLQVNVVQSPTLAENFVKEKFDCMCMCMILTFSSLIYDATIFYFIYLCIYLSFN